MAKVAIVDYGMGNLDSVRRAVEECGGMPLIAKEPLDLQTATHIILPGVGAFPQGIGNLRKRGFAKELENQVLGNKIPFLGICLGMQLLAGKGWEVQETEGLGFLEGEVKRLTPIGDERVPHIGWDEVMLTRQSSLFTDLPSGKDFYFVHSFHLVCEREQDIIATTPYCGGFVSAVNKDNIFGVQFHPEKSQGAGFQMLVNFLKI